MNDLPEPNPRLRAAIMQVVENQLRDNAPPETRQTFERLCSAGYSAEQARELIAAVVATEIFDVLKYHEPFDQARFVAALKRLPKLPFD